MCRGSNVSWSWKALEVDIFLIIMKIFLFRRCGVDVILSNTDEIKKIATRERDRILISSGKAAKEVGFLHKQIK